MINKISIFIPVYRSIISRVAHY